MKTTQKPMTVKEILTDVSRILGNIDVPAARIEQIGIPIAKAINGINVCLDAIERAEHSEPEISIEQADSTTGEEEEEHA